MPDKNDPAATAETIRAAAIAEENRINKIREITKDYPTVTATAIKEGYSVERAELETVKAANVKLTADIEAAKVKLEGKTEAEKVQAGRPEGANIVGGKEIKATQNILAAAACMGAGMNSPDSPIINASTGEKKKSPFSSEECEIAASMKIRSLSDLIRATCAAEGKPLNASRHEPFEMVKAAFSTANFANILSNVQNKFILQGFFPIEQAWREISYVRNVKDFKPNTGVRFVMATLLKALAPTGEIQHGVMSDEARTVQADTKALMLSITRKDLINDDLGILSEAPMALGQNSALTFNVDFWAAFKAAVATMFTSGHKNTTTGPLTAATLTIARNLFTAIKAPNGSPLGLLGSVLLTGSTAAGAAEDLFISSNLTGGTNAGPDGNRFRNKFKPVQSAYLDDDPWVLAANPKSMPLMEVAFLNGNEMPTVESSDMEFNMLGIQCRAYYDYGASAAEWRGGVYSTGK